MLITAALARLFTALLFSQASFNIYLAALPLYLAGLDLEPTMIGLLVGAAAISELIGAFLVGPAIDRLGARSLLLAGVACYLVGSLGFLVLTAVPAMAVLRLIQGLGLAAVLPSAYSYGPNLARAGRQALAFASIGSAGSVAGALAPLLGLSLLGLSPSLVFGGGAVCAVIGGLVAATVPAPKPSRRPYALAFQLGWLAPLLVGILTVTQWGVITAFLPLAAADVGVNSAVLFTADAISVFAARLPAGWIADRYGPLRLALVGVVMMALSPLVLLLPLNEPVLIAAGILNGGGAGLTLPPMLSQLSQRSDAARRGTALSYFSMSFALGILLGSSVGGLLYPWLQFHGLLIVGAVICLGGLVVLLADAVAFPHRVTPAESAYTP
jgi:MFS family permease